MDFIHWKIIEEYFYNNVDYTLETKDRYKMIILMRHKSNVFLVWNFNDTWHNICVATRFEG